MMPSELTGQKSDEGIVDKKMILDFLNFSRSDFRTKKSDLLNSIKVISAELWKGRIMSDKNDDLASSKPKDDQFTRCSNVSSLTSCSRTTLLIFV